MKNEVIMKALSKNLIVSCQALANEPLHSSFIMSRMSVAAVEGGAQGIRANSASDINAIKQVVDCPVIGIAKVDYPDAEVYITPSIKEVDDLVTAGADIIAVDATNNTRPNGQTLQQFFQEVKNKYPEQLFMADCSTVTEAIQADELGFDFIAPTLVGYTPQSKGVCIAQNDFALLKDMISGVESPVIAEGNIDSPSKAKRVLELGAYAVVVGSMITRPQLITKKFADALVGGVI
ncbi:MAG: N-acetylmannosamine-6-phosphate 2-epimerase [Bacilli bacterium]